MAWLSLIKSIPVTWKREIEAIDQEIGPAHYGNALLIMTFKNVYSKILKRWLFTSAVQDTNVIVGLKLLTTWTNVATVFFAQGKKLNLA